MNQITHLSCLLIVLSTLFVGCGDSKDSTDRDEPKGQESKTKVIEPPLPLKYSMPDVVSKKVEATGNLESGSITFAEHVSPIMREHCVECHQPGESGPFSLITYKQVQRRARQIVEVTKSGFMPPWVPVKGVNDFKHSRGLSDLELATLERWQLDGMPSGDLAEVPALTKKEDGWALGKPDLVLSMPKPFVVPAEGKDVFQTFVFPIPIQSDRYVRAIEIKPDNLTVAHHAILNIDKTRSCQIEDAKTPEPGYPGMDFKNAQPPSGYFLGWTPGKRPAVSKKGMAWPLTRGSMFALQMHLVPSGKPENFTASIGVYFTDERPTAHLYSLEMRNDRLDIKPEDKSYEVEDSILLSVPVKVHGIYPHAHYIGKEFRVFYITETGEKKWLFYTDDWDFSWQDSYEYATPATIPANSRVVMQIVYDNSSDNSRNPSMPPKRVQFGLQSDDEMGTCSLMLEASSKYQLGKIGLDVALRDVERHPENWIAHKRLGQTYAFGKKYKLAIASFEKSLELADDPEVHYLLGNVLAIRNRVREALPHFEKAASVLKDDSRTQFAYGLALTRVGRGDEAEAYLARAINLQPMNLSAYQVLAADLKKRGKISRALRVAETAAKQRADLFAAHDLLVGHLMALGQKEQALQAIDRGLQLARKNKAMELVSQLSQLRSKTQRQNVQSGSKK